MMALIWLLSWVWSVTVKLAPGALVTQLTIRWARFRGFPTFSAFSLNSQLAIAQGNVPVHAGYGKRIGRGNRLCSFPKSVCIHALTE